MAIAVFRHGPRGERASSRAASPSNGRRGADHQPHPDPIQRLVPPLRGAFNPVSETGAAQPASSQNQPRRG